MKITCAKKFDNLDSMIQDMEKALDDAQVNSATDITKDTVQAGIEFLGSEQDAQKALDIAQEAEKVTNDLLHELYSFSTILDKFDSMFERTNQDAHGNTRNPYELNDALTTLDSMLNDFLNDIDDVYLTL